MNKRHTGKKKKKKKKSNNNSFLTIYLNVSTTLKKYCFFKLGIETVVSARRVGRVSSSSGCLRVLAGPVEPDSRSAPVPEERIRRRKSRPENLDWRGKRVDHWTTFALKLNLEKKYRKFQFLSSWFCFGFGTFPRFIDCSFQRSSQIAERSITMSSK